MMGMMGMPKTCLDVDNQNNDEGDGDDVCTDARPWLNDGALC